MPIIMGNPCHQAESAQNENQDQKPAKDGEGGTRKPGSKAQGRKRTKTGCLSKLEIYFFFFFGFDKEFEC